MQLQAQTEGFASASWIPSTDLQAMLCMVINQLKKLREGMPFANEVAKFTNGAINYIRIKWYQNHIVDVSNTVQNNQEF